MRHRPNPTTGGAQAGSWTLIVTLEGCVDRPQLAAALVGVERFLVARPKRIIVDLRDAHSLRAASCLLAFLHRCVDTDGTGRRIVVLGGPAELTELLKLARLEVTLLQRGRTRGRPAQLGASA